MALLQLLSAFNHISHSAFAFSVLLDVTGMTDTSERRGPNSV